MGLLTERQLVAELARHAIMRVSPEEKPLFRAYSSLFSRDPLQLVRPRARWGEALGFGPSSPIELISGACFAASAVAVACLRDSGREAFRSGTRPSVSQFIEPLLRRMQKTGDNRAPLREAKVSITPAFLKRLRDVLFGTAVTLGISEEKSGQLSDALIGRILDVCHDPFG